jgi:hypothetical protein
MVGAYLGKRRHGDGQTQTPRAACRPRAAHVRRHRVRAQWHRSRAVLEDVGDDVDGLWDVLAEALGVVNRLFTRSVHIEVGAEILSTSISRAA